MIKINIQRDKAKQRERVSRSIGFIICSVFWLFISSLCVNLFGDYSKFYLHLSHLPYIISFVIIWEISQYYLFTLKINSLEYSIDKDILISKWKVILQHKDTARLQVVNSVDINQDIIDKIFGLYSVTVDYGFSQEGYQFYFNYLTEDEAEMILTKIKPSGRVGVNIK